MPIKLKRNYKTEEENVERLYNAFSRAKYELESKKKKDLLEDLKLNTKQHYLAIYRNQEYKIRVNNPQLTYKSIEAEIYVAFVGIERRCDNRWAYLNEVKILGLYPEKMKRTKQQVLKNKYEKLNKLKEEISKLEMNNI